MFSDDAKAFFFGAAVIGFILIGLVGWGVIEGALYLIKTYL